MGRIRGGDDDGMMVSEGGLVVVIGARPSPLLMCDASRLLPIPAWPTIWRQHEVALINQQTKYRSHLSKIH